MRGAVWMGILAGMASACVPASAFAGNDPVLLGNFDAEELDGTWEPFGATVRRITPAGDGGSLEIAAKEKGQWAGVRRAIDTPDLRGFQAIRFRAAPASGRMKLEIRILDMKSPELRLFCRVINLEGDAVVTVPLHEFGPDFREGLSATWDRIGSVEIFFRDGGRLLLDEVNLIPGERAKTSCYPTGEDLLALAFPDGDGKLVTSENFLLVTDDRGLAGASGRRLLSKCEEGWKVLRSVLRIEEPLDAPVPLVVFTRSASLDALRKRVHERLGLTPEGATGWCFTWQGITACVPQQDHGSMHESYIVHEAMHPALQRSLRLATSNNWIQEGLATFIQRRQSPKDFDERYRALSKANFRQAAEGEGGPIRPFAKMLADPDINFPEFTVLASFFEYLAAKRKADLPAVWKAVRNLDGPVREKGFIAIAEACSLSDSLMDREWLRWGATSWRD